MDSFSRERDQSQERVSRVQGEIEEVRQVMVENIDRVLERGEKIELLVDKAENLNSMLYTLCQKDSVCFFGIFRAKNESKMVSSM